MRVSPDFRPQSAACYNDCTGIQADGGAGMDIIEQAYGGAGFAPADVEFRRCMFEALTRLMQTAPLDDITVADIAAEAHVSRASFYRRFRDKYDLLNSSYELILHSTLLRVTEGAGWRDSIRQIYRVIGENAMFFKAAFASSDRNSLERYIFDRTLALERDILETSGVDTSGDGVRYRLCAYVAGGLQLTKDWVASGAAVPLDELVDILVEMVPEPFRAYFT